MPVPSWLPAQFPYPSNPVPRHCTASATNPPLSHPSKIPFSGASLSQSPSGMSLSPAQRPGYSWCGLRGFPPALGAVEVLPGPSWALSPWHQVNASSFSPYQPRARFPFGSSQNRSEAQMPRFPSRQGCGEEQVLAASQLCSPPAAPGPGWGWLLVEFSFGCFHQAAFCDAVSQWGLEKLEGAKK